MSLRIRPQGDRGGASGKLLAVLVGAGAALAGIEMLMRTFAPQPLSVSYLSPLGLTLHIPSARIRYIRQEFDHYVRINSLGIRDDERTLQTPPGVSRILLLGDSFVEGKQVASEELFSKRVQSALQKRFSEGRWEVINGGVSGYGTADEIRFFELLGRRFEARIVVLAFSAANDLADNRNSSSFTWDGERLEERPLPAPTKLELLAARIKEFGASHFHLWQLVRGGYHAVVTPLLQPGSLDSVPYGAELILPALRSRFEEDWRMTEALLDRLRDSVERAGAPLLLVVVPARFQVDDEEWETVSRTADVRADRDELQRRLAAYAGFRGLSYVDLLPALRDAHRRERVFYRIDGHLNARGHAVAAEEIFRGLVHTGLVSGGRPDFTPGAS